jgi:hypothetical protein
MRIVVLSLCRLGPPGLIFYRIESGALLLETQLFPPSDFIGVGIIRVFVDGLLSAGIAQTVAAPY